MLKLFIAGSVILTATMLIGVRSQEGQFGVSGSEGSLQQGRPNGRLRFRRPPKLRLAQPANPQLRTEQAGSFPLSPSIAVSPDPSHLLAAALAEQQDLSFNLNRGGQPRPTGRFINQQNANNALENLLATAAAPTTLNPTTDDINDQGVTKGRRIAPAIPRRKQGPQTPNVEEASKGLRQPAQSIRTTQRYSHKNDDGSFTFGYMGEDGSFREETRGVDCITRGRYGYIDPDGKSREFTYVSGLPCDTPNNENNDAELQEIKVGKDPIDPSERFKATQAIQLKESEIPIQAIPRQRIQPSIPRKAPTLQQHTRRPTINSNGASNFQSFQSRPRAQTSIVRRVKQPISTDPSAALNNLFSIVDDKKKQSSIPSTTASSPITTKFKPSKNDLNQGFELNRPAITFDQSLPKAVPHPQTLATAAQPNFNPELVFDPISGTFKTNLQQKVHSSHINKDAALAGNNRIATAAPKSIATVSSIKTSTRRPTFSTATPTIATTSIPTSFVPLSFPSSPAIITQTQTLRPKTHNLPLTSTQKVTKKHPTPVASTPASVSPANTFFFQPFPTVQPSKNSIPLVPTGQPNQEAVLTSGTNSLQLTQNKPSIPAAAPINGISQLPFVPNNKPNNANPTISQLQFGFQPVQHQQPPPFPPTADFRQPQPPFTAFSNGKPPQLRVAQQFQTQFQPKQNFGHPLRPNQLSLPSNSQRFNSFGRPSPGSGPRAPIPFTVFNPASIRQGAIAAGARFK